MDFQIKELRKDLIDIFDEEYEARRLITPDFAARKLAEKGYQKQIKAEWVHEGDEIGREGYVKCRCSNCFANDVHKKGLKVPYCWNCGAAMKGAER